MSHFHASGSDHVAANLYLHEALAVPGRGWLPRRHLRNRQQIELKDDDPMFTRNQIADSNLRTGGVC